MAIDYHGGRIDTRLELIVPNAQTVVDMEVMSVAIVGAKTVWHTCNTQTLVELNHPTYQDSQISDTAMPEDWMRIIRIPEGYVVDGSHLDIFDDEGRYVYPLETFQPNEADKYGTEAAVGYIKSEMQLEGVRSILREIYAFEIGESYLLELRNKLDGRISGDSDSFD